MKEVCIVPYEPKYREMVRDCVYVTGFGGENVEPYFEDRDLFADMLTLYYTDYEPESGFVALVDGEPGGYLLGGVDTARHEEIMKNTVIPLIIKNLLKGEYALGHSARQYAAAFLRHKIKRENIVVPSDLYPAHLHIDLFKEFRRMGVGVLLINTYLNHLRQLGIRGVHLVTSSYHVEALPFYDKLGFARYSIIRQSDRYRSNMSQRQYYEICYVKSLENGAGCEVQGAK